MRKISSKKMVDIARKMLLSSEGFIYDIGDLENEVNYLSHIAKISCGEDHALALSVNGDVYSWGVNNTYGELAKTTTSIIVPIKRNAYEIKAGSDTTFIKTEDNSLWASGCNKNGRIGLGTAADAKTLTKIDVGEEIESMSQGHTSHTGLVGVSGNVYMTGINTYGELGNKANANLTSYTKIGDTIIDTSKDIYYLDVNEQIELTCRLINTFNLKIDLIDDNKENFNIAIPDASKLKLENYNMITAINSGVSNVTITHTPTKRTKQITIKVLKKMNDIIQGVRDNDFTDGLYEILVNDEVYNIEVYNYYDDMEYKLSEGETSKKVLLGNNTADQTMLVVKYHKNLNIGKGVTLTSAVRKKGMYICVLGDTINEGEITMTARGANVSEGQNVYLWENIDSSYEYVPKDGAAGLAAYRIGTTRAGVQGNAGNGRQTGGGGQGAAIINANNGALNSMMGSSTGGNSYAGGNGAGAVVRCNSGAVGASATRSKRFKRRKC